VAVLSAGSKINPSSGVGNSNVEAASPRHVVAVFNLVMITMAAIKANGGEDFRYPLCIRFIK